MRLVSALLFCFCILIACSKSTEPEQATPVNNDTLCTAMPAGLVGTIRISGMIPNPTGQDNYAETFLIKNYSKDKKVSLAGWKIKNKETVTLVEWELSSLGELASCEEKPLVSNKNAQLLNSGDTVKLYNSNGELVQILGYSKNVAEGDTVKAK